MMTEASVACTQKVLKSKSVAASCLVPRKAKDGKRIFFGATSLFSIKILMRRVALIIDQTIFPPLAKFRFAAKTSLRPNNNSSAKITICATAPVVPGTEHPTP